MTMTMAGNIEEQRQRVYWELIEKLLNCPKGEGIEILQANSELLDRGFVQILLDVADELREQEDLENADRLMNIARYLLEIYVLSRQPQRKLQADRLLNQGVQQFNASQFRAAIESWEESLAIYREIGDLWGEANSLGNLGAIYNSWGQYQKAIEYQQQSLGIKREIGDRSGESASLCNLGIAYGSLGQYQKAIEYQQQSLVIEREMGNRSGEAASLCNLGNVFGSLGQYQKAIEYQRQSLVIKREIGNLWGEASSLANLGIAYHCLKEYDKATEHLQQSLVIFREIGDRIGKASLLANFGNVYLFLGQYHKAIDYYQQCLAIQREIGNRRDEANSLGNLGNAYWSLEQYHKAIDYYQQCLAIQREIGDRCNGANFLNNLGSAYYRLKQISEAIEAYKSSLEIATPSIFPVECFRSGCNLGNMAFTFSNWQLAIEGYKPAIAAIEQSRNWETTDQRRQEILEESIDVYEHIVQACINLGQIDKAIEYVEHSRSRHLSDLMASNDLSQDASLPLETERLSQDYDDLQRQINAIRHNQSDETQELVGTRRLSTRKASEADIEEIKALESQKQKIWQQLRQLDPILAGHKQVDPLSVTQIQALIDSPTTAILSFYTTHNDTYIFILFKDKAPELYTYQGQGIETFQNWIVDNWFTPYYLQAQTEWKANMGTFLQELSQRLQLNDLIAKHLTSIEELILIPHLRLHLIPFAALPLANASPTDTLKSPPTDTKAALIDRTLNQHHTTRGLAFTPKPSPPQPATTPTPTTYLGDKFRLRVLPSCQVLNYCHQRPPLPSQTMGIVEDATEDLPFTRYECQTLAETHQVPPERRLRGSQATLSNYKTLISQVQVIHTSHHASSDLNNPLASKLKLADGELTLGQLLTPGWRMPNLGDVFACCCEVNFTLANITDDILSIATGFLCAGARSVVSTLWSVEDLPSALLAIFYYQNRETMTRSQALQQAQIKLRTMTGKEFAANYKTKLVEHLKRLERVDINGDEHKLELLGKKEKPFAHPYYWAGFVSQGLS